MGAKTKRDNKETCQGKKKCILIANELYLTRWFEHHELCIPILNTGHHINHA